LIWQWGICEIPVNVSRSGIALELPECGKSGRLGRMETNRLEAFSDGVLAIIITIMVLEMKVPHGADFAALIPLLPVFLSYVLSFI
jgi:Endosomal/lysosomal potassium channel TMEM175